jgi:hypothetical protein
MQKFENTIHQYIYKFWMCIAAQTLSISKACFIIKFNIFDMFWNKITDGHMFYPIGASHNPGDHEFCTMSWNSHVNLRFSYPVVHGKKYLNDSILFLHFCDPPPPLKDMTLHLSKLEFPSCKSGLYQFWLKLAWSFIRKIHSRIYI